MKENKHVSKSGSETRHTLWVLSSLLLLLGIGLTQQVSAQIKITGKVSDMITEEMLPGVSIAEKESTSGTITSMDGSYSIEVADSNAVLEYSSIGYEKESIKVTRQTVINVKLNKDIKSLQEIVVVGYGTQKKLSLTGAVSSIKGDEIADHPVANISNSLAGEVSGVSMRPKGGQPGKDNPDIYIRGIATTGGTAPLVVVDGIIRDNISKVDPATIETVTILKDAAAVAPYGMGGANGVILVTTKAGKAGKTSVTFSSYYGKQTPTVQPDMLNVVDYMTLRNAAYYSNSPLGTTPPFTKEYIDTYNKANGEEPDKYPNSIFYKDIVSLMFRCRNTICNYPEVLKK